MSKINAVSQNMGLGLSPAYDIVKAHGGEIKVNTKVDSLLFYATRSLIR